jgi:hypothetical protein
VGRACARVASLGAQFLAAAIAAGADYLVVGRPVTQAKNPLQAAEAIIAEIASVRPETPKLRAYLRPGARPWLQILF